MVQHPKCPKVAGEMDAVAVRIKGKTKGRTSLGWAALRSWYAWQRAETEGMSFQGPLWVESH